MLIESEAVQNDTTERKRGASSTKAKAALSAAYGAAFQFNNLAKQLEIGVGSCELYMRRLSLRWEAN